MTMRIPLSRRRFLAAAAASTAMSAVVPKPYLSHAADRPVITHGIRSGDVSLDSAGIWARADRPARMLAEVATSDSFKTIRHAVFVDALPETDFTANALIDGLPAGQDIFYRIRFQDLFSPTIVGEPMTGRFRTAPNDHRSISFVCSRATAPQACATEARPPTGPSGAPAPISSSTTATTFTPTAQSWPSRKCPTAKSGKTS